MMLPQATRGQRARAAGIIAIAALLLPACSRGADHDAEASPVATMADGDVRAEVFVTPAEPTIAEQVTIRVVVTRPADERVTWPDWAEAVSPWSIDAVAVESPQRLAADEFSESVVLHVSPFLPGAYVAGPMALEVADRALVLDEFAVTVAGPPPGSARLDELLPEPAGDGGQQVPGTVWIAAGAVAVIGIMAGLVARRWDSNTSEAVHAERSADLERTAEAAASARSLDSDSLAALDHAARTVLADALGRPASWPLSELARGCRAEAIEQFACELERLRFRDGDQAGAYTDSLVSLIQPAMDEMQRLTALPARDEGGV